MTTIAEKIKTTYQRIREKGADGVWISLVPEEENLHRAAEIEARREQFPLAGKTFAIKDNIDLAGLPTTAACPEFSYEPKENAHVVQRLIEAGAIPIGKTNLDQFATGLNGTRTPYEIPRNSFDPRYIPGGSSSGSAVAVAMGEVDFALGTDTAGSGRVPAAFNNLVGFKPTKGRWSTRGLLPACRSLDCITVFGRTLEECAAVDEALCGYDEADPFSRQEPASALLRRRRIGVLAKTEQEFFGDPEYEWLYHRAIEKTSHLGWETGTFDYQPFLDAASLLYSGPWVAERHAALKKFLHGNADAMHPTVRSIVEGGAGFTATDAFEGQYRLAKLARRTEATWAKYDALLLPTAGTIYKVDEMLADPIRLNSNLGRYTNFVNLLDLCAIAIPAGFRSDGLPFGVTLIGPAWSEARLLELAGEFLEEKLERKRRGIQVAVVGAHLRGQPLNSQLTNLEARFVCATHTAPEYRLHALPHSVPPKPGMVRGIGGRKIEVEVWEMTAEAFGKFVAAVPPPLCIGTITLENGDMVKGFLCESEALKGATEITEYGGWRNYLADQKP